MKHSNGCGDEFKNNILAEAAEETSNKLTNETGPLPAASLINVKSFEQHLWDHVIIRKRIFAGLQDMQRNHI